MAHRGVPAMRLQLPGLRDHRIVRWRLALFQADKDELTQVLDPGRHFTEAFALRRR
jgi:hypothetical protein